MSNCLCINPNCPKPQRASDEQPCQACASPLLLNGRYRATHLLHQRNIVSAVFEAIDAADGNNSKVLKVIYTDNEEAISRFNREADVLMNHWFKGIPRGYPEGYFHVEFPNNPKPAYCLVMEKIEGMNLQEWMDSRENQPISEREAIDWLRGLVIILGRLHEQNEQKFYHRDIKPSNIMRRENGQLILIDLGAARAVTQAVLNGADVTRIGTDGYGAPEQLRRGQVTAQSDFYALGRTFVHLLTGKYPNSLPEDSPEKLRWLPSAPQVSKQFADLIDSLMAHLPEKRPESTTDIFQRLEKIERDLQFREQLGNFFNFQLTFRHVAGGIFFILVIVLFGFVIQHQQSTTENPIPSPTPPESSTSPDFNDKRCNTEEDGTPNNNRLAKYAQEALNKAYDSREANYPNFLDPRARLKINQTTCTVKVEVRLKEGEIFNAETQENLRQIIYKYVPDDVKVLIDNKIMNIEFILPS